MTFIDRLVFLAPRPAHALVVRALDRLNQPDTDPARDRWRLQRLEAVRRSGMLEAGRCDWIEERPLRGLLPETMITRWRFRWPLAVAGTGVACLACLGPLLKTPSGIAVC